MLDRLTQLKLEPRPFAFPPGAPHSVCCFHVGHTTLPVNVTDKPCPSSQQQGTRTVLFPKKCHFVYKPKLFTLMQYRKERRRGEHGKQFEEVAPPVRLLACTPQPKHPLVVPQYLLVDHPLHQRVNLGH